MGGNLLGLKMVTISVFLFLGFGGPLAWSAPNCDKVQVELQEMQKAQGILLEAMAKKNDSLASTLEHYADDLSVHEQRPAQSEVMSLRKSAEAFRGHGDREMALILKFQRKSRELVEQAVRCLSQNDTNSSLKKSAQISQIH